MECSTPGFPFLQHLPELAQFMSIEVSDATQPYHILCHPLLLPSIFPSIRVFPNQSVLHIRWPKYWYFSFNISPSNEHPGLISFRMDWLDLLAVQGTLRSLLQHHSSKASILWCSAFFTVQLSHPYVTPPVLSQINVASYPHQHPELSVFWILAIVIGVCVFSGSVMSDSLRPRGL